MVLQAGIALGVDLGLCGQCFAQGEAASQRPKEGDLFVKVGDFTAMPLRPADLLLAAKQTMVWPMDPTDNTLRNGSRLNRVMLLRMDPEKLSPETKARATDGVVAYTAICTHAGCEVTEWVQEEQLLHCPCHESKFEPKDGAKVVDGPAPRMLPALPLKLVEGKLAVAKPFTAPVGFEVQ
jgi:Rieske Fe-S protein